MSKRLVWQLKHFVIGKLYYQQRLEWTNFKEFFMPNLNGNRHFSYISLFKKL